MSGHSLELSTWWCRRSRIRQQSEGPVPELWRVPPEALLTKSMTSLQLPITLKLRTDEKEPLGSCLLSGSFFLPSPARNRNSSAGIRPLKEQRPPHSA